MKTSKLLKLFMAVLVAGTITGCSTIGGFFGDDDDDQERLPGERYTVLELEEELEPDPVLEANQISIPEAWNNQYWPQYAGYPNHAMGHVGLGQSLKNVWNAKIGEGGTDTRPLYMPPIVADNVVFTMDTNLKISAVDANSGNVFWARKLPVKENRAESALGGGLAYHAGRIYATSGLTKLFVLNPQNGQVVQTIDLPAPARAAPSVLDGKIYVQMLNNSLNVYSAEDFKLVWAYDGFAETTSLLGATAPAVDKDVVVAAFSSGEIVALQNQNGQTLWTDSLASVKAASALASIADIKGAVVLDKGLAYALSYNGRMIATDIASGRRVWQRNLGGTQTPWASGNVVYVVTGDRELVALSRVDGRIHWVTPLGGRTWYGPVLAGGRLIAVEAGGQMVEYDAKTGKVLRSTELKSAPASAPVVSGNRLFVLLQNGTLAAYR